MPLNISIDVDGTLLDENENVHPQTRKQIEQLKAKGYCIQLWSTCGADYALRKATEKGLADLFDSFGAKPDVAIDDIPESARPSPQQIGRQTRAKQVIEDEFGGGWRGEVAIVPKDRLVDWSLIERSRLIPLTGFPNVIGSFI